MYQLFLKEFEGREALKLLEELKNQLKETFSRNMKIDDWNEIIENKHLEEKEKKIVENMIRNYEDIFGNDAYFDSRMKGVEHSIELTT